MSIEPEVQKNESSGLLRLPELSADAIVANCNVIIPMKGTEDINYETSRPVNAGLGAYTSCACDSVLTDVKRLSGLESPD